MLYQGHYLTGSNIKTVNLVLPCRYIGRIVVTALRVLIATGILFNREQANPVSPLANSHYQNLKGKMHKP